MSEWLEYNLSGRIMRNGEVIHNTPPFDTLSADLANESVEFIKRFSKLNQPFFLLHSFAHVHTPMFSSPENRGRSKCGEYVKFFLILYSDSTKTNFLAVLLSFLFTGLMC